jgi:hypothetical protein
MPRRSRRLQRYIDLGLIDEEWAVREPEAAKRDADELARLEIEEGPYVLPPGRSTWRGIAGLATVRTEAGVQTVITDTDGRQTVVAGELSEFALAPGRP